MRNVLKEKIGFQSLKCMKLPSKIRPETHKTNTRDIKYYSMVSIEYTKTLSGYEFDMFFYKKKSLFI